MPRIRDSRGPALLVALLLTGCGGESAEGPCISSDECTGGLICVRGECLDGCNDSRDCGFGEICVGNACVEDVRTPGGGDGFTWQTTAFGDCGTTCGSSEQTREVRCIDLSDGSEVDGTNCPDPEPSTVQSCVSDDDCAWVATDWSDCSVTCGTDPGVEVRTVRCEDTEGEPVDVELCASKGDQPVEMRDCSPVGACSWLTGAWSDCSVACGEGTETRSVTCVDASSDPVADTLCDDSAKPAATQSCSDTCGWVTGAFGACSVTCGTGTETRSVECRNSADELIPEVNCTDPKPATSQSCGDTCGWVTGPYGPCDETCGNGSQTRSVECQSSSGDVIADSNCTDAKPQQIQSCFEDTDCGWFIGGWGSCSVSCSYQTGTETRVVDCRDETNTSVNDAWCALPEPASSRSCTGSLPENSWFVTNCTCEYEPPICIEFCDVSCPDGCCDPADRPDPVRSCVSCANP